MKIFLSLFFLISLMIAAVVQMPAAFLYEQFLVGYLAGKPISVTVPTGNVWHGQTSISSTKELPLVQVSIANIEWEWKPEVLKNMAIGYEVLISQVDVSGINFGNFIVNVNVTEEINVTVKDYGSPIKLDAQLQYNSNGALLEGNIKTKQPNPQIDALLGLGQQFIRPQGDFTIRFK